MTLPLDLDHEISATIISCGAPTVNNTEQENDDLKNNLHDVISQVQYRDKFIPVKEFSTRVSDDYQVWDGVLCHRGIGCMNSH